MSIFLGDYVYPEYKKELQKNITRIVFLKSLEHYIPETLKFIK